MAKLIYDKENKIWKHEGAKFRQVSKKVAMDEISKINKYVQKNGIKQGSFEWVYYEFEKEKAYKLMKNLVEKGEYEKVSKFASLPDEIVLEKHYYSWKMKARYWSQVTFQYDKHEDIVKIKISDGITIAKTNVEFGWKFNPVTKGIESRRL